MDGSLWQVYVRRCCLNCIVIRLHMVIAPVAGSEKGFMNDISCPGFCSCRTLCSVSSRRYQTSAFTAACHHCDCGCLLHTYSLRTWFLSLGFLMAETLLVVDTCPCGVVLFARSNEKCTHQSVEFIKEWDFHRLLIYETANCLLWPRLREMRCTHSHSE